MCMVSNVSGYGQQTWPNPQNPFTYPYIPSTPNQPQFIPYPVPATPTEEEQRMKVWWEHFKKALEAAKEFDKATGQPDCVDPEKEKWMEDVLRRLEELEKKT